MILCNADIVRCLDQGSFRIDGLQERDPAMPPFNTSAVDLRLGNEVLVPESGTPAAIDLRAKGQIARFLQIHSTKVSITQSSPYTLTKGRFILANTLESVSFPLTTGQSYSARVEGKSSLARCGILIHSPRPRFTPGFNGSITLEMINLSEMNFLLYPGMYICQLIIEEVRGVPQDAPNQFRGQTTAAGL